MHCARCGAAFTPRAANQRYCSTVCRDGIRPARASAVCPNCGCDFVPRVPTQRYCCNRCRTDHEKAVRPKHPEIECEHCGAAFSPRVQGQRFCGQACQVAAVRKAKLAAKTERRCERCGRTFVPRIRTQAYCSERCRNLASSARAESRKAAGTLVRRPIKRRCPICGRRFTVSGSSPSCCSEGCSRAYDELLVRLNADFPDPDVLKVRSLTADVGGHTRRCQACGISQPGQYFPAGHDVCLDCVAHEKERRRWLDLCRACTRARRDSARCAECGPRASAARKGALSRALGNGFGIRTELVRPHRVWARDDYTCHICGLPTVERGVPGLEPVLDHVRPVANGGTHTYDNIRCAHALCNSVKSDSLANPDTRRAVIKLIAKAHDRT